MTHIEKLDFVLEILYKHNDLINSHSLFKKYEDKISAHDLRKTVNHLKKLKYVKTKLCRNDKNEKTKRFICSITYSGFLFFENGGFNKENKTLRLNHNWKIAKTIAATANALIIIFISIWAIIESKKEPSIKKIEKEIELLKNKVEKMNFIKKDSLKINNLN